MTELVLTVLDDDYAYLELESEELGISPTAVVAMLVRKARKASERPVAGVDVWEAAERKRLDEAEAEAKEAKSRAEQERQRAIEAKRAKLQAELAALDMKHLDELEPDSTPSLPEFDESLLVPEPVAERAISRAVAPRPNTTTVGSMTAPVGLRNDLKGGDVIGDPMGNIVRRNFGHLK